MQIINKTIANHTESNNIKSDMLFVENESWMNTYRFPVNMKK